uniref:Rab28 n=1 Tax=Suberites domuncula TaxID=55567 RepID=A1XKS9_SUBDO|nr:Rab28 [Suberites domuncula]
MADSDDDSSSNDRQLKFILLGDGTTGKTSLVTRYSQNHFGKTYQQTLGLDFFMKRLKIPGDVNVTLQVWDIGGQAIGGKMLENYIFGAHAVLLVYDITNYSSFENLDDWLAAVTKVFTEKESLPHIALVANKLDLEHTRTVRKERHNSFAKQHKMSSHFVSAKTDDLLNQMFLKVVADVLKIKLSGKDLSSVSTVVKAEIASHGNGATKTKQPVDKRTKRSFCTLQ